MRGLTRRQNEKDVEVRNSDLLNASAGCSLLLEKREEPNIFDKYHRVFEYLYLYFQMFANSSLEATRHIARDFLEGRLLGLGDEVNDLEKRSRHDEFTQHTLLQPYMIMMPHFNRCN